MSAPETQEDKAPSFEWLTVGAYVITPYPDGGFWITHENGEGMQVWENEFIKLIDDYYKAHF